MKLVFESNTCKSITEALGILGASLEGYTIKATKLGGVVKVYVNAKKQSAQSPNQARLL